MLVMANILKQQNAFICMHFFSLNKPVTITQSACKSFYCSNDWDDFFEDKYKNRENTMCT